MVALPAAAALAWTGRAAWLAGLGLGVCLVVFCFAVSPTSPVAVVMFGVPGFLAGTVLRQRRQAVDALARRGRQLEEERELFAEIALRHGRARIASELHDIVGHATSVMVGRRGTTSRRPRPGPGPAGFRCHRGVRPAGPGRPEQVVGLLGGTEVGDPI